MSYRYILSISYTEMGQLNIYNPIYCKEKKVIDRTSSMLTTPPEDTLQTMMVMEGNKMSKTEYDLKAIMYSAYKLCSWKIWPKV